MEAKRLNGSIRREHAAECCRKKCRLTKLTKETRRKFSLAVLLRYRRLAQHSPAFPRWYAEFCKGEGETKGLLRPFVIVSVVVPWHPTENTAKPIKTMSSSRSGRSLVEVREWERRRECKREEGRWRENERIAESSNSRRNEGWGKRKRKHKPVHSSVAHEGGTLRTDPTSLCKLCSTR